MSDMPAIPKLPFEQQQPPPLPTFADAPLAPPTTSGTSEPLPIPLTAEFPLPPHRTGPPLGHAIGAAATAAKLPASADAALHVQHDPPESTPARYPSKANLESVAERIVALHRDTEGHQPNGRFTIYGGSWGGYALEEARNGVSDSELKEALDYEREVLAWAAQDPVRKELAAGLLGLSHFPAHIQQALGGPADNMAQFERLLATESDGSPTVPDDLLLQIIADHQNFRVDCQVRFDTQLAGDHKQEFAAAVHSAANGPQAWLPKQGLDNLASRLDRFRLVLDDGFDTTLRGTGGQSFKTVTADSTRYAGVLSPYDIFDRRVSFHEMFHALVEGEEPYSLTSLAGAFGHSTNSATIRSLTEAIADYGARSLQAGSAPAIDQIDWANLPEYSTDTRLLQTLATRGARPISMQSFLAAACENSAARGVVGPAAARLRAELAAAFPDRDVVADLGNIQAPTGLTSDRRQAILHTALNTYLFELENAYPRH